MKHGVLGLAVAFGIGCMLACSADWDDERLVERHLLLADGREVGNALVLVDQNTSSALLLNVKRPQNRALSIALPTDPIVMQERNDDAEHALILSRGRVGDSRAKGETAALTVLSSKGDTQDYRLGTNAFDHVHQSPDGAHAVLRRTTSGRQLVQNLNELAIVSLDRSPEDEGAVTSVTLERPPLDVVFSDGFEIRGEERRLAALLSLSVITLIDLDHLEWKPTLVDLSTIEGAEGPGGSTTTGTLAAPMQVVFDAPSSRIFVRGNDASDVFVLRLAPRKQTGSRSDLATSVDIVAAGRAPTDMALYDLGGRRFLIVTLPSNKSAMLVDIETSRTVTLGLPGAMNRVLVRNVETESGTEPVALVWQEGGNRLATVRLDLIGQDDEVAVRELPRTQHDIARMLEPDPAGKLLCLLEGRGLAIVDPASGSVAPYATDAVVADALVDEDRRRLWVAPPGENRVAYVDIRDGATSEVRLDSRYAVPVLMRKNGILALVHADPLGYVTFVDVEEPTREKTWSARGFLSGRILD